jgi:alpha-glucosidase
MNMVFQFEHLDLWDAEKKKALDIIGLKKTLTRWQKGLENNGWNALFIENHDKPRVVSTWGNDEEYWYQSATSMAAMYFLMQGTPFIYQGQELGMTNVQFPSIDDYDDVAVKNMYRLKREAGVPHEELMEIIWASARDNSRTPMQWSAEPNAGFTTGTPWMKVNPNYVTINVGNQENDAASVLSFYKKMIKLRKENPVFTYGIYDLVAEDHPQIYAYTRSGEGSQMMVVSNLTQSVAEFAMDEIQFTELLLNNYPVDEVDGSSVLTLHPYETRVYRIK